MNPTNIRGKEITIIREDKTSVEHIAMATGGLRIAWLPWQQSQHTAVYSEGCNFKVLLVDDDSKRALENKGMINCRGGTQRCACFRFGATTKTLEPFLGCQRTKDSALEENRNQ